MDSVSNRAVFSMPGINVALGMYQKHLVLYMATFQEWPFCTELIRGNPEDTRCEVREILEAFEGNPRMIVGTGDKIGRETPEENLYVMIGEATAAQVK